MATWGSRFVLVCGVQEALHCMHLESDGHRVHALAAWLCGAQDPDPARPGLFRRPAAARALSTLLSPAFHFPPNCPFPALALVRSCGLLSPHLCWLCVSSSVVSFSVCARRAPRNRGQALPVFNEPLRTGQVILICSAFPVCVRVYVFVATQGPVRVLSFARHVCVLALTCVCRHVCGDSRAALWQTPHRLEQD